MPGPSKAMQARRDAKGKVLPQEIQEPIRERLRLLRLSRSRQMSDLDPEVHLIAPSTLGNYENHDISSLKLYHLYGLARWLDINFLELVAYLFDADSNDTLIANRQTNSERMIRLMSYLSEGDQKMACDMVDAVVESRGRFAKQNVTKDQHRRVDEGVQGVQATAQSRA